MTILHLVRHGETDWNRQGRFQGTQDIPLNDAGRRQAEVLAHRWNLGGEVLLSSPLSRARETAEILAPVLKTPGPTLDPMLRERSYGHGEGLTLTERRLKFGEGPVPGLELPHLLTVRARAFLDAVHRAYPGRRIVAVSHGGFINAVLGWVTEGQMGTGKTFLGNASVTTLVHHRGRWAVREAGRSFEAAPLGLRE